MEEKFIDQKYMAYLLLQILYKEGYVNSKTYENIIAEKKHYLRNRSLEQGKIKNKRVA